MLLGLILYTHPFHMSREPMKENPILLIPHALNGESQLTGSPSENLIQPVCLVAVALNVKGCLTTRGRRLDSHTLPRRRGTDHEENIIKGSHQQGLRCR